MTSGPPSRTAPAVVPAGTTCSLPARVMRSSWLDTADSSMVGRGWLPDAIGAGARRGLTGPGQLCAARRLGRPPQCWEQGGGEHHGPFGSNFLTNGPWAVHGRPPERVLRRPGAG